MDELEKLFACFGLFEGTAKGGGGGEGVLLFHAAHLHTHVFGLDDYHHSHRVEGFLDGFHDLEGEALLYLKAVGEDVHYTGYFGEPADIAVGNIGYVGFAVEGEHVVFAKAEKLDVANNDHLFVVFQEFGTIEHCNGVHIVTASEGQHCLCDTFGSFEETFAIGVFAEEVEDFFIVNF